MKKPFLTLAIAFTLVASANAQFTFEKIDGGSGNDNATTMIKTNDGGFVIAGSWVTDGDTDPFLRKIDADGNTIWQKTYGGSAEEDAYGVVQTADGGYTLLFNINGGINKGAYLLKTNSIGETLWQKKVSATKSVAFIQTSDEGYAIAEKYAAGNSIGLVRANFAGDTLWTRHYVLQGTVHAASALIETNDGGFAITGETSSPTGTEDPDIFLLKTNLNGNLQWDKRFGVPGLIEEGFAVLQIPDGSYLIGGTVINALSDHSDALLIKTNSNGVATWARYYNYEPFSYFYQIEDLKPTNDGNYIMCGWSGGLSVDLKGFLLKVNPQGDTLMNRFFVGKGQAFLFSVIEDSDGQFLSSGQTRLSTDAKFDIYFSKTGSSVSTKESETIRMHIEPNPIQSGQSLHISLEGIPACNSELFDALGRLVWQRNNEPAEMDVPAPTQPGIYALVATTKDGSFAGRYLVEVQ